MPPKTYTHRRPVTIPGSGGKRRWLTGHGSTQRQAERDSQRRVDDYLAGLASSRDIPTLRAYLEPWLQERVSLRAKPQTVSAARRMVTMYLPALGDLQLDQIDPARIQRAIGQLLQTHKPSTVARSRGSLSMLFNDARKDRYIVTNPVPDTTPPRIDAPAKRVLSAAEANALLTYSEAIESRFWPCWVLMLTYPLRVGEVLGLLWRDIREDEITITGQVAREGSAPLARVPYAKTRGSLRTLPMMPEVRRAMVWHYERSMDTGDTALVFPGKDGKPREVAVMNLALRRELAAVGLPGMTSHGLRHSVISRLRLSGSDAKIVMALAGHVSMSQNDRYTHATTDDLRRALTTELPSKEKKGA